MTITKLPHAEFDKLPSPLVILESVSFTYPPPRRVRALDGVSLTIERGEFVGIIGHNGSGKTTLTKCISGHLKPSGGRVTIGGHDIVRVPIRQRPRFVGYTFQNPDDQIFKASVWDEVCFGLQNLGYKREVVEEAAREILQDLGLWEQRNLHPYRLSKGGRQRLSIACLAVMQPAVLIVDEPTTGQDPMHSREIMDLLEHLRRDIGLTILVVTHAMDLVVDYCTRVIAIAGGQILADGTPTEVFAQPELLATTFVQPPPVVRLALQLGLDPLPINVSQVAERIFQEIQRSVIQVLP